MQAWAGLGYYSRARNLHACAKARGRARTAGAFPATEAELAHAAGHRRLYGGGDRRDRLRPAGRGRRRQCRAGRLAALHGRGAAAEGKAASSAALTESARAGGPARRFRAGADGSRRDDLHAEAPGLRALPVDGALRGAGRRLAGELSAQGGEGARATLRRGAAFVVLRADDSDAAAHAARRRASSAAWPRCRRAPGSRITIPPAPCSTRPLEARWQRLPGIVRHVFTHFPLELTVFLARVAARERPRRTACAGRRAPRSPRRRCRA